MAKTQLSKAALENAVLLAHLSQEGNCEKD